MTHLIEHAAAYFNIDPRMIVGKDKHTLTVRARHVVCFVLRQRFSMSFPRIGKLLHRDHSSMIYAYDKILWARGGDPELVAAIDHLMEVPCSRFIPAWHKQAKECNMVRAEKPVPWIEPVNEYADPPALCPPKAPRQPAPPVFQPCGRNDFDTGVDKASSEAIFRKGIRRGSNALLDALRAA